MEQLSQIFKAQIIKNQVAKEKTSNNEDVKKFYDLFRSKVFDWSEKTKKDFVIDAENLKIIQALVLYHAGHSMFEELEDVFIGKPSLEKGIILCGNVGSGKTLLMKLFNDCFKSAFKYGIIHCDLITDKVRKEGIAALDSYQLFETSSGKKNTICFEDLGIENSAKYYGDTISPMYDLIIKRYRLFTDFGLKTHFTTNLKPSEWANHYDTRTDSRLREMCNIIKLGGKSDSTDRRLL